MTILILNHLSHHEAPYEDWLREVDEPLVLLTSTHAKGTFDLRFYEYVEGFDNYYDNGTVEGRAFNLHSQYNFSRIIALSELDILRAAYLRDALNIPGQNINSALAFRDKVFMKELVQRAGLNVPKFSAISSVTDILQFASINGFPIVIKPRDGSGSELVRIVRNREELDELIERPLGTNLEVEQYVQGNMYSVDGYFANGKIQFMRPSKYINGALAHQDGDYYGCYLISLSNPLFQRLTTFVYEVLNALPKPEAFAFHAELFHTSDDRIVLCEIASRAGGWRIREVLNQCFDVHLNKMSVQHQCNVRSLGEPRDASESEFLGGCLMIPPRKGVLAKVPNAPSSSWLTEYRVYFKTGEKMSEPSSSADKLASFVVIGGSEDLVSTRLTQMADWFHSNVNID